MAMIPHFHTLSRFLAAIRAVHAEIRTERLVHDMPDHLRKDIGWPDIDRIRVRRHGPDRP